jgi:hypothetical protein
MKSITDLLPLRDSTAWNAYREARPIPHRYGECGGEPIQYDASRRLWVWADHPSLAVDAVLVDGLPVTNWRWRNAVDSTDQAVTFVEFTEAVEESSSIVVRGRGKIHATSGALVDNVADVLFDLLVSIAGLSYPAARFDNLRAAAAGLTVGGSIETVDQTFKIARAICASIGAVFSPDLPGFGFLSPAVPDGRDSVDARGGMGLRISATARRADLCNDLTVRYAIEAGSPRGAVQYDVPTSIDRVGRLPLVVDAPWITSGRVAAAVAERMLGYRARRRWNVRVSNVIGAARIGTFAALNHPLLPGVTGSYVIESVDYDDASNRSEISFVAPVDATPPLRFLRNTLASSAIEPQTATAAVVNNEYGFVVTDVDARPIPGATCVLDPSGANLARRSDSTGWVSWPLWAMTPGAHTVIVTFDGRSLTIVLTRT